MALRRTLITAFLCAMLAVPAGVASASTTAAAASPATAIPVTGTFTDATGGTGAFAGTLDVTRFANRSGDLTALGTVGGTLTDSAGTVLGSVSNQSAALPVSAAGTCQILHLELGPIDLNLLGLMVHLDKVVLDITAQSGPGNLLGNLLCAVAHLLDGTGTSTTPWSTC
jgi:hypothetical protein